jgi:hypothetical protein
VTASPLVQGGGAERDVEEVGIVRVGGDVVDVLVAGDRLVRQVPALVARDPRDALELLPAAPAVRAAIDARRLGARELCAHEAEGRCGESSLDALPAPSAVDAAEQPVTVGPGQPRVAGRMQRRDAMALQPEGLEPSVAEP